MKKFILLILLSTLCSFNALSAQAASPDELKEQAALIINLNGYLCAKVTEVRPLQVKDQYEITCIEYRGGSGTVHYIFDPSKGTAIKAG